MKYIEKEYKKFASYLVIYGETEKELNENFAIIKRFSELFEPQLLKRDQIKENIGTFKQYWRCNAK